MKKRLFFGGLATLLALRSIASFASPSASIAPQENLWVESEEAKICRVMKGTLEPGSVPGEKPSCKIQASGGDGASLEQFCKSISGVWHAETSDCLLLPQNIAASPSAYSHRDLNQYGYRDILCGNLHFLAGIWDDDDQFKDIDGFKCKALGGGVVRSGTRKEYVVPIGGAGLALGTTPELELFHGPPVLAWGGAVPQGADDPALSSRVKADVRRTARRKIECDTNELLVGISSEDGKFNNLNGALCSKFESPTRKLEVAATGCHYLDRYRRHGGPHHADARMFFECREGFGPTAYFEEGSSGSKIDVKAVKCCPYSIKNK